MFRPTSRLIARSTATRALPRNATPTPTRRFLSTAPPTQKARSWKSLVARVGIAGAIVYYYNTTDVFAEEPRHAVHALPVTDNETETETAQLPTIEALAKERQLRKAEAESAQKGQVQTQASGAQETATAGAGAAPGGVEALEEEADQQGAFNPETGEINWDCPCLGGMADGPCGEQFKAAFSCFVYSNEEPKGVDCIEKFKDMQNCFREYPEVYGSELDAGDEEDDMTADRDQPAVADSASTSTSTSASSQPQSQTSDPTSLSSPQAQSPKEKVGAAKAKQPGTPSPDAKGRQERAKAATTQVAQDYGDAEKG
ncbi:hypothetical protein K491DRAFT_690335, partial [Lophiostoma macrostomum CBS 122681]